MKRLPRDIQTDMQTDRQTDRQKVILPVFSLRQLKGGLQEIMERQTIHVVRNILKYISETNEEAMFS